MWHSQLYLSVTELVFWNSLTRSNFSMHQRTEAISRTGILELRKSKTCSCEQRRFLEVTFLVTSNSFHVFYVPLC